MLRRFMLYGMPVYIAAIEYYVGIALSKFPGAVENVSIFRTGPSLAVAGISLLLPVLIPKPPAARLSVGASDTVVFSLKDYRLIELATALLFATLAIWVFDLYLSHQSEAGILALVVGILVYFIGVALT